MIAIKDNMEFTITEVDVQSMANDGYDVYDDNGNVVAYAKGKTVPFEKYIKQVEVTEKLENEIIDLREKIKKLEKKGK